MKRYLQSILLWGLASIAVIGTLLLGPEVQAADQIFVRYKDTETTITLQELNNFTDTGELPTSLQNLLKDDRGFPQVMRTILSRQIQVSREMQDFLEGDNSEFLLLKLDQAISSANGSTDRNLEYLRKAVIDSSNDDQISFLEIIDRYPQRRIRIDLTRLEGTFDDMNDFAAKVLPALEVARDILSDFIHD